MASLLNNSSKNRFSGRRGNRYSRFSNSNNSRFSNSRNHMNSRFSEKRQLKHRTHFNTEYMCSHILQGNACPNKETCKKCHTPEECVKAEWKDQIESHKKTLNKLTKIKNPNPIILGKITVEKAFIKEIQAKIEAGVKSAAEWEKEKKEKNEKRNEKIKESKSVCKMITIPDFIRPTKKPAEKDMVYEGKNYVVAVHSSTVKVIKTKRVDEKSLLKWLNDHPTERELLVKQRLCQEIFELWDKDAKKPIKCPSFSCSCEFGKNCPWNAIKISELKIENSSNQRLFKKIGEAKELTLCARIHEDSKKTDEYEDDLEDENEN